MFFRREKPKVWTFDDRLNEIQKQGFRVARKGSGKAVAVRDRFAAVVEEPGELGLSGIVLNNEIAELVHGGFQVRFESKSGQRQAARAADLQAYHAFVEDLREALGLKSLYNESLGTVNGRHLYDRVRNRDQA